MKKLLVLMMIMTLNLPNAYCSYSYDTDYGSAISITELQSKVRYYEERDRQAGRFVSCAILGGMAIWGISTGIPYGIVSGLYFGIKMVYKAREDD